jgi:hypothetical protein
MAPRLLTSMTGPAPKTSPGYTFAGINPMNGAVSRASALIHCINNRCGRRGMAGVCRIVGVLPRCRSGLGLILRELLQDLLERITLAALRALALLAALGTLAAGETAQYATQHV